METQQAIKLQQALTDNSTSSLKRYGDIAIGRTGFWNLIKYELIMLLFGSTPGALGLMLRKAFFPRILGHVGEGVIFGRNITIRHGHKIRLGDRVVLDDNVVLDAKGDVNEGIIIENDSLIGRNSVLSCKGGNIHIGESTSIGINSLIHAVDESDVIIGDHTIIAAFVYIIGGGNYHMDRLDMPIKEQGTYSKGGVTIGEGIWIASHVQVLDGVHVGKNSVLAAGAVVNRNVSDYEVVGGVPAKAIKSRMDDGGR